MVGGMDTKHGSFVEFSFSLRFCLVLAGGGAMSGVCAYGGGLARPRRWQKKRTYGTSSLYNSRRIR